MHANGAQAFEDVSSELEKSIDARDAANATPNMIEFNHIAWVTEFVPVIDVEHITQDTFDRTVAGEVQVIAAPYAQGLFVRVPTLTSELVPQDLAEVLEWARRHEYEWVRLDRGADLVDDIPAYGETFAE